MTGNTHRNPNPQGKGLVTVLADWQAVRPVAPDAKAPGALLFDWFVSALVLSADFRFRPAVGQRYYLYLRKERWQLSLVGPGEWGAREPGACLGCCELRTDMTWTLTADSGLSRQPELQAELARLIEAFGATLDSDRTLADELPGYRRELPYFQRMLATALGSSLRASARQSGCLGAPARELLAGADDGLRRRLLENARHQSPVPHAPPGR